MLAPSIITESKGSFLGGGDGRITYKNDPGDLPPLLCQLGGGCVSLYCYFMYDTYWLVNSLLYCRSGDVGSPGCMQAAFGLADSNLQTEGAGPTSVNLLAPRLGLSAFS